MGKLNFIATAQEFNLVAKEKKIALRFTPFGKLEKHVIQLPDEIDNGKFGNYHVEKWIPVKKIDFVELNEDVIIQHYNVVLDENIVHVFMEKNNHTGRYRFLFACVLSVPMFFKIGCSNEKKPVIIQGQLQDGLVCQCSVIDPYSMSQYEIDLGACLIPTTEIQCKHGLLRLGENTYEIKYENEKIRFSEKIFIAK